MLEGIQDMLIRMADTAVLYCTFLEQQLETKPDATVGQDMSEHVK